MMTIPSNGRNSREGRQAGICFTQRFPYRNRGARDHEVSQVSILRLVLKGLEKEARDAKKGLWADPQPVPPWVWRMRR